MRSGISFIECEPGRLPQLGAFFRRSYSDTYRLANDERLLQWQFGGLARDTEKCHVKLAISSGDIQACLGYIPVELTVAGKIAKAAWTANWMVDPSCRRLGLGPLLLRELVNQFDAVLSVGLEADACVLLPRMGFVDFGDLTRYVCVLDVASAAGLTESGHLDWPRVPLNDDCIPRETVAQTTVDPDLVDLWDRVSGGAGAGTRRSTQFLTWRYAQHPTFAYRFLTARSNQGPPHGLAIYRVEDVRDLPVKVGRIVELISEPATAGALVRDVLRDARSQGVAFLDFFCSSRALEACLLNEGFLLGTDDPARQLPLLFQPVDRRRSGIRFMAHLGKLSNLETVTDWYVTKGDGDQDRPN